MAAGESGGTERWLETGSGPGAVVRARVTQTNQEIILVEDACHRAAPYPVLAQGHRRQGAEHTVRVTRQRRVAQSGDLLPRLL
ncbi:hypothetical protein [Actinacidiphila glaucinigra]|uniref:hypothetical protein n=1 Tax=Actinacidiphila glaucinigra TaxID=235986 RepID=UPI0036E6562F